MTSPVLIGSVFLVTALTGVANPDGAPPKQIVIYESKADVAECRADLKQARENLGHVPGSPDRGGILMDCVETDEVTR